MPHILVGSQMCNRTEGTTSLSARFPERGARSERRFGTSHIRVPHFRWYEIVDKRRSTEAPRQSSRRHAVDPAVSTAAPKEPRYDSANGAYTLRSPLCGDLKNRFLYEPSLGLGSQPS